MANSCGFNTAEASTKGECGIYQIKCIKTNKIYIGSSKQLKTRKRKHFYLLSNNKHHNNHLQNIVNSRGIESLQFEIIELCSQEDLVDREQYYIDTLKPEINILKTATITSKTEHTKKGLRRISDTSKETFKKFKIQGIKSGMLKLNYEQVITIKEMLYEGRTNQYIAKIFNVTPNNISFIATGVTWKEVIIDTSGLTKDKYKDKSGRYKYSDKKLIPLFREFSSGKSCSQLSKEFGIHERMVAHFRNGDYRKYIFNLI